MDIIAKKRFVKAVLDKNSKTIIMHVVALEVLLSELLIYLNKKVKTLCYL